MKKALTIITAAAMITVSAASVSAQDVQTEQSPSTYTQLIGASVGRVTVKSSYSSSTSAVRIKWNKVSGANGYRIYRRNAEGNWVKIKTITKSNITEYRDSGLSAGTRYQYKVKAYAKKNGKTTWGKASEPKLIATKPSAVKFKSFSATQTAIRLNWTPVECEGYQIYQKIGGKYVKIDTIRDKNTTTYKIDGLSAETKYSFKIRAFSKDGAGKVIYTPFAEKVKTTKGVEWTEVDKAYYNLYLGYPKEKDAELISEDISNYIIDKFGKTRNIRRNKDLWRIFEAADSEQLCYNFNERKFIAKKDVADEDKVDDAHFDQVIYTGIIHQDGLIPLKDGYTKENYLEIQKLKQECYAELGDESFELIDKWYDEITTGFCFNIGIDIIPDGQTCVGYGDYYDDKDPWHIPQCNIWFCDDSSAGIHDIGDEFCVSAK